MIAFNVKLIIERGATFRKTMIWKTGDPTIPSSLLPVNITGYTARMQIRSDALSSVVIKELTTSNGGIVLGGSAGTIVIYMTDTATGAFTFRNAVYDLFLTTPIGDVIKFMEGAVTTTVRVTR